MTRRDSVGRALRSAAGRERRANKAAAGAQRRADRAALLAERLADRTAMIDEHRSVATAHRSVATAPAPPTMEGAPWYVKAVLWTLSAFGVGTFFAVAIFMVYLGWIPSPLRDDVAAIKAALSTHTTDTAALKAYIDNSVRIQRQTCRNGAPTPVEKLECDR